MGAALDALMDLAHDWGAPLQWGSTQLQTGKTTVTEHWVCLTLPDGPVEHRSKTRDAAAWLICHELRPDPADRAEA